MKLFTYGPFYLLIPETLAEQLAMQTLFYRYIALGLVALHVLARAVS